MRLAESCALSNSAADVLASAGLRKKMQELPAVLKRLHSAKLSVATFFELAEHETLRIING